MGRVASRLLGASQRTSVKHHQRQRHRGVAFMHMTTRGLNVLATTLGEMREMWGLVRHCCMHLRIVWHRCIRIPLALYHVLHVHLSWELGKLAVPTCSMRAHMHTHLANQQTAI